jgi:chaperone required for assembly of F1-ATPase
MKRFYKRASASAEADGHRVLLDGRPVLTPARRPLVLPTAALAGAVAAEWEAQGETVAPATMPLTQLSCTTLDRVLPERPAMVERLAAYGETDLLCHRADRPADLVSRQEAQWQPLLDWASGVLGIALLPTVGILAVEQPPAALDRLRAVLADEPDMTLGAVAHLTGALGSVVLALALARGRLDAAAALAAAFVDEDFQIERWGFDTEAAARRQALAEEVSAAERLIVLAQPASRRA